MDAYAIHPYPNWTQPLAERGDRRIDLWDLPLLQSIVGVPVMAMEFGWSTSVISEAQQAQWLSDAIEVARCTPGLTRFTLWGFHDHPGPDLADGQQWGSFGLLRQDGSPKPSLAAVTAAMHDPISCAEVALRVGAPPGWVPAAEPSIVPTVAAGDPAAAGLTDPGSSSGTRLPGGATQAGQDPGAIAAAGSIHAAVLHVVRRRGTWWAIVKLSREMGVGGRLDRVPADGRLKLVRVLQPRPVNAGVHRVRLGKLQAAASYRVTFTCRAAGVGRVVTRRLFIVRGTRTTP